MKYRVHRFDLKIPRDQNKLAGEIVAIIPNVTIDFLGIHKVDFVLIVEKRA